MRRSPALLPGRDSLDEAKVGVVSRWIVQVFIIGRADSRSLQESRQAGPIQCDGDSVQGDIKLTRHLRARSIDTKPRFEIVPNTGELRPIRPDSDAAEIDLLSLGWFGLDISAKGIAAELDDCTGVIHLGLQHGR